MLQVQKVSSRVRTVPCLAREYALTDIAQAAARRMRQTASTQVGRWQQQRGLATPSEPYDAVIIGGGARPTHFGLWLPKLTHPQAPEATWPQSRPRNMVCGYVRSLHELSVSSEQIRLPDGMYREAWLSRRNVSQRWLHSLKSDAQQLAYVPPDEARPEAAGN